MGQLTEPTVNEVLADRQTTHLPDEIRHPEHEPELRILRRGARLIRRDCGPRGIGILNGLATVRPTGSVTLRDSQSRTKGAAVDHGPMCR